MLWVKIANKNKILKIYKNTGKNGNKKKNGIEFRGGRNRIHIKKW